MMIFPSLWSKFEQSYDDIQLFEFIKLILFVLFKTPKMKLLWHLGNNFQKLQYYNVIPTSKLLLKQCHYL